MAFNLSLFIFKVFCSFHFARVFCAFCFNLNLYSSNVVGHHGARNGWLPIVHRSFAPPSVHVSHTATPSNVHIRPASVRQHQTTDATKSIAVFHSECASPEERQPLSHISSGKQYAAISVPDESAESLRGGSRRSIASSADWQVGFC